MKKTLQRKTKAGIISLIVKMLKTRPKPKYPITGRGFRRYPLSSGVSFDPIIIYLQDLQAIRRPECLFSSLYFHYDTTRNRFRTQGENYFASEELGDIIQANVWFFDAVKIVYGR